MVPDTLTMWDGSLCSNGSNNTECGPRPTTSNGLDDSKAMMSAEARDILVLILFTIFNSSWSLLGIATNTVNIIVFRKMGFQETVNLSFFALAISDLCSLMGLLWISTVYNPFLRGVKLPFDAEDMGHLMGGWPHVAFARVTGWITAFVTVERFLCIAKPLAVKRIITPVRVKVILTAIFVVNLSAVIPIYCTNLFVWKNVDNGTRSIVAMAFTADREEVENKANMFNQVASPISSFGTVLLFTMAMFVKLQRKSKWRRTAASSAAAKGTESSSSSSSNKDTKAGKMMLIISSIFVVCFTPTIIIFACMAQFPEFSWQGQYRRIYFVVFALSFNLEGLNSSVNIFVYYRMSSKYKEMFDIVFKRARNK